MQRIKPPVCFSPLRWAALLLVLLSGVAQADCPDGPFVVEPRRDHYSLEQCFWYLEDASAQMSLRDVREARREFDRHTEGLLNPGYSRSVWWVRFQLEHRGERDEGDPWLLEVGLPLVDDVQIYLVSETGTVYDSQSMHYERDWSGRYLRIPNPVFPLQLTPHAITEVYVRIQSENTIRMPLSLYSEQAYTEKVAIEEWINGLFIGAMLALFAYNLFLALVVREAGYGYYVAYILSALLFLMTESVHGVQVFGSLPWWLHKDFLPFYIQSSWLFGLLMARELLDTRNRSRFLDVLLLMAVGAVALVAVACLFLDYYLAMLTTVIGSVSLIGLILVFSYRAMQLDLPTAAIYLIAWLVMLIGISYYALAVMGLFELTLYTQFAPQFGFVGQIILLSLAFANRVKQTQQEALDWSERALSNLERYRSLFDNAIEGIFQMSADGRFTDVNPSMARMMGYPTTDDLILDIPDAIQACFADPEVSNWVRRELEEKGFVQAAEGVFYTRSGEERWANVSVRTIYREDGEPLRMEGTFVDVTERKEREQAEKERENERLEKEVARSSAAAKSQFLANMSHEIRTPLAAIIGYGETLLEPDLSDSDKRNSAETVVRSGRHLLELINDILDHSKIDANKLEVEILPVNLPELLDEVRAFFSPRIREKGLDFRIQCQYPLPETIHTDPTRFRQILINLCGNALKFTEQGHIHILIRCDGESQTLYATVEDTGIGMKPDQQERLFNPFAQGSNTITRQYGGTGLGLSISRRLAQLLGGDIRVESVWGKGSAFEVAIDCGSLEGVHFIQDSSEMSHRRRQLPMIQAPRLRGHILCAEDNDVNWELVELLVRRTGAEIDRVTNGAEAIKKVVFGGYDLVLMDIQMPIMNGREATRILRERGFDIPVVALTANILSEDLADYREAGCNACLAKPIDKQRFYETLAEYLTLEQTADEPARHQYEGTVLVAEDNPDSSHLVRRLLERHGLTVVTAENGEDAVRQAMSDSVHLVLMDSHMPEMEGVEATRLLRQTGFRRPIIAFTAGDETDTQALREAGCDGVLNKPIDTDKLQLLLQKHLQEKIVAGDEDDPELSQGIAELAERFLAGLPERQIRIEGALKSGDGSTLQREVHQIKGTAGAMGYPHMTDLAAKVLQALKDNDVPAIREHTGGLLQEIREVLNTD